MIEDFNGRVAVVTGGASDIGKAIAAASKAAGMIVLFTDVERAALDKTCEELAVDGKQTDVTDLASVKSLAASAGHTGTKGREPSLTASKVTVLG